MSGGIDSGLVGWLVNSENDFTSKVKACGVWATHVSTLSGFGMP